jgi:N-acetylneuraminic acid mutarotase
MFGKRGWMPKNGMSGECQKSGTRSSLKSAMMIGALACGSLFAAGVQTPMFPYLDGEADRHGTRDRYERHMDVRAWPKESAGWVTFRTDGHDFANAQEAFLHLFVEQVKSKGVLQVFELTEAPEPGLWSKRKSAGKLKYDPAKLLAEVKLDSRNEDVIIPINISEAVKDGHFLGLALVPDDKLWAQFDSREGLHAPLVMLRFGLPSLDSAKLAAEIRKAEKAASDAQRSATVADQYRGQSFAAAVDAEAAAAAASAVAGEASLSAVRAESASQGADGFAQQSEISAQQSSASAMESSQGAERSSASALASESAATASSASAEASSTSAIASAVSATESNLAASSAAGSAEGASVSANAAASSAQSALAASSVAESSASAAASSAASSEQFSQTAETAATSAQAAIASAQAAATQAGLSASQAGASANQATTAAGQATASAATASTSANQAVSSAQSASGSAQTATTKATQAASSASSAANSSSSSSASAAASAASAKSAKDYFDAMSQLPPGGGSGLPSGFSLFSGDSIAPTGFTWTGLELPFEIPWGSKASLPAARGYAPAALLNGKIHLVGGYSGAAATRNHYAYDPNTDSWETLASLPANRMHHSLESVGGKLYLIGGNTGSANVKTVYIYDPALDTWTTGADMSLAARFSMTVVLNGRIHVLGGNGSGVGINHDVYDPATNSWSMRAFLISAREQGSAVLVDGQIHLLGGRSGANETASHEVYHPNSDQWESLADLPQPMRVTAVVANGRIHTLGGAGSKALSDHYEYDSVGDQWITRKSLTFPRYSGGVVAIDEKIYLIGGWNGSKAFKEVEVYRPGATLYLMVKD